MNISLNLLLLIIILLETHISPRKTTYQSGGISSQIDYILVRRLDFQLLRNIKVFPGEEVVTQH